MALTWACSLDCPERNVIRQTYALPEDARAAWLAHGRTCPATQARLAALRREREQPGADVADIDEAIAYLTAPASIARAPAP